MINFEEFKTLIVKYIQFSKVEGTLREMNIDVVECPMFDTAGYYLDRLWEAYFTEEGGDTISWWMFEYHDLEEDFDTDGSFIGGHYGEPIVVTMLLNEAEFKALTMFMGQVSELRHDVAAFNLSQCCVLTPWHKRVMCKYFKAFTEQVTIEIL